MKTIRYRKPSKRTGSLTLKAIQPQEAYHDFHAPNTVNGGRVTGYFISFIGKINIHDFITGLVLHKTK